MDSLVHARPGDPGHVREAGSELGDVVAAVNTALNTSYSLNQVKTWLDPADPAVNPTFPDGGVRVADTTHDIWAGDPGICQFLVNPGNPAHDGKVATIEVSIGGGTCSTPVEVGPIDCSDETDEQGNPTPGPVFTLCGDTDVDGDFSVNLVSWGLRTSDGSVCVPNPADPDCVAGSPFCTTTECVNNAQATLSNSAAVAVPFSAATDGRDHWLSAGEPHCADCHAAPYVEQSGNINAYPPFNYPQKASLMRYSRGHQDISCQGCHESIHGLYPVTPDIDTTSYAQAASLNHDGSHGPLKCGTCHEVGSDGIPTWVDDLEYNGEQIGSNFDRAVSWMHTYTEEASPRNDVCRNCHGDEWGEVSINEEEWLEHADKGRVSRSTMDKAEIEKTGHVFGDPEPNPDIGYDGVNPLDTVCRGCHGDESDDVQCGGSDGREWKQHLVEGRVAEKVWIYVSELKARSTCGW